MFFQIKVVVALKNWFHLKDFFLLNFSYLLMGFFIQYYIK